MILKLLVMRAIQQLKERFRFSFMKSFFRVVGFLEGLSFILLLFVAMPIKYIGGNNSFVKMLGMPHGLLFVAYVFLAIFLAIEEEWGFKNSFLVLIASVIPFGTFYVDHKILSK